MRVLVLHSHGSGYFSACLRALQARGADLSIVCAPPNSAAPFDPDVLWADLPPPASVSGRALLRHVNRFHPDIVLLSGWARRDYCLAAFRARSSGAVVLLGMDNQWNGAPRQRFASAVAAPVLRSIADFIWIPGQAQLQMAAMMGFPKDRTLEGRYSADVDRFVGCSPAFDNHRFLFVGRLSDEKGLGTLLAAWQTAESSDRLSIAGTGPRLDELRDQDVDYEGFVQPNELPSLLSRASWLVLPSYREPWGVVVHEALSAGLPVITNEAVGAAQDMIQDGVNGYLTDGSQPSLESALRRASSMPSETWASMSAAARIASKQFSPGRWAETVMEARQS